MSKILYINTHAAKYGWYFGRRMPDGYRFAAKFWGSGLIDRTKTLYLGFPYAILYPLPLTSDRLNGPSGPTIASLCDVEASRICEEADHAKKDLEILWSGGIDSTAALVGILKAASARGFLGRAEILLTAESVNEYPLFFERFIKPLRHRFVKAPVTSHLNPTRLIVTGEHGDQIFGSAKAAAYVADGRAFESYKNVLPAILTEKLGSSEQADTVIRYIEPLLAASPIPLLTIFDAFWWINFTLKWQIVGLRLAVFRISDTRQTFNGLRHFFSSLDFQRWSLQNHSKKIVRTWESYKMPLKDYIFSFTGDDAYRRTKTKVPSLKAVFITDVNHRAPTYRVLMDEEYRPIFWPVNGSHREPGVLQIPYRNRGR